MPSRTGRSEPCAGRQAVERAKDLIAGILAGRRLTLPDLLKRFPTEAGLSRRAVSTAVRELTTAGDVAYRVEHGRSYLEPSFDRPVRVSERIILTPPGRQGPTGPRDVGVTIAPGAAFGNGSHPTTRLALRGIDAALTRVLPGVPRTGGCALDIGTGSGVLVIAAVALGIGQGEGIDRDPCAVSEARSNVRLNGLGSRIHISDRPVEDLRRRFALISANLRAPTLVRQAPLIGSLAEDGGVVVISGIRPAECRAVLAAYETVFFKCVRVEEEYEWTALVLEKLRA
jgi:ribosomal protein L11 methyltransferase